MRRYGNSSKVMNLLHCLFHTEPFRNVYLNAYREDMTGPARYLRSRNDLKIPVHLGGPFPDKPTHYAIMVCNYHPLKASSDCSLYHVSWRVQRVEPASMSVAVNGMAMGFPFQDIRLLPIATAYDH